MSLVHFFNVCRIAFHDAITLQLEGWCNQFIFNCPWFYDAGCMPEDGIAGKLRELFGSLVTDKFFKFFRLERMRVLAVEPQLAGLDLPLFRVENQSGGQIGAVITDDHDLFE